MVLASYLAYWLRFDGAVPFDYLLTFAATLPLVLAIRLPVFLTFGLFFGLWRYASVWDLSRIVIAVFTSSVIVYAFVHGPLGPGVVPRSVLLIETLLLVCLVGGIRLAWRLMHRHWRRDGDCRRVLIVGAGDAGEMIVREMQRGALYQPVGFIDDDPGKTGRTIHGVNVYGTRRSLPAVLERTKATEVLVAIPSAPPGLVRGLVRALEPYKVPLTTLPGLHELVQGKVGITNIRPLAVEDLLPRPEIMLDGAGARRLIEGRRVLVTGAGGSIGSELCRQIAAFRPAALIAVERYENSLYAIANELLDRAASAPVHPVVGDVTDVGRVEAILAEHRPHIVFHAAAHKHVPLMEANPCEAIKNNVRGTQVMAEAACRHGVERFVLISTDKAANPSSVMGASKRVAELIAQAACSEGATHYGVVRFGNVLGSNGSVIPRMMDQIRSGGPVTVTHPDITRYFMLTTEAVALVLQAAVLTERHATFVLDMGEQIKILDLARNLIRLSGAVPDKDIHISFIGLREGEKLSEELTGVGETLEPTSVPKVSRVQYSPEDMPSPAVMRNIARLIRKANEGDADGVLDDLRRIVPTFTPADERDDFVPVPSARSPRTVALPGSLIGVPNASHAQT